MKKSFFYYLILLLVLGSCASYHNKIRKQPVDKKTYEKTIITQDKKEVESPKAIIQPTTENSYNPSTEIVVSTSLDKELNSLEKDPLFDETQDKIAKSKFDLKTQEEDTIRMNDEFLDIAFRAEKNAKTSLIIFIISILPLGLVSLILFILGFYFKRKAEDSPYITEKGARYLRSARTAMNVSWIYRLAIFLLIIILMLIFLFALL